MEDDSLACGQFSSRLAWNTSGECFFVRRSLHLLRLGLESARPKRGDEVKVHYVGTLQDGSEHCHVAK